MFDNHSLGVVQHLIHLVDISFTVGESSVDMLGPVGIATATSDKVSNGLRKFVFIGSRSSTEVASGG